jgi:hypothetical protein
MVIKQIKPDWWSLSSDDGIIKLIWFGRTREEVLAKFRSWLRWHDLERVRVRHGM